MIIFFFLTRIRNRLGKIISRKREREKERRKDCNKSRSLGGCIVDPSANDLSSVDTPPPLSHIHGRERESKPVYVENDIELEKIKGGGSRGHAAD